jgi:hypothetical protein
MDGVADWQPLARALDERVPQRLTISPPDLRGASQVQEVHTRRAAG